MVQNSAYKFELMKSEPIQSVIGSPKWQAKPKLHRYPTKRWGHTGVISKSKLYIYGGKTGRAKEPLYEIDCESFQSHIHQISSFPQSRQSHSCSLVKQKLLIWGGCRQQKALNDCIGITVKENHCYWSQIAQIPMLKQRESHATTVLKDKYIMLYGGCNDEQMYDDFWIFNTELQIWLEIKLIINKMKKRIGCTLTTIKDKIYMFGGETEQQTYQNSIYCLSFTEPEIILKDRASQMKCQKIVPASLNLPQGRSCHSAVSYQDRYLIILAGEGQGTDSKGKSPAVLLNDVWCFDTEKNTWEIIDISNRNVFKPRSCFTANILRNKIFVFGGLISIQGFKSSDQLLVLSFSEPSQNGFETCNLCKLHYRQSSNKQQPKINILVPSKTSFQFAIPNLYKISRMIKNPFDSISLIIEAFSKMKFNSISIDLIQGKLFMVQGTGSEITEGKFGLILNKYQFVRQINTEDPAILQAIEKRVQQQNLHIFSFNLKNACSRLGQNFIFINRRGILIDIMLVTPDNAFYCEFNSSDHTVGEQQQRSYQIISTYLHRNNLNINLMEAANFALVITDLQRISPTQYELKVNGKDFIQLTNSIKKTNLQTFCQTMFLRKPQLKVTINNKIIQFRDQHAQFSSCTFEATVDNDFKDIKVRQSQKQTSVFIYRGGMRVGKFSKNKKPYFEGYVEISLNYQLNLLRNRIQNYRFIEEQLQNICKEFEETGRKRNHTDTIKQYEEAAKVQ